MVAGQATVVTDPAGHARLCRVGPRSWAPSPDEVFVRIAPGLITGRQLVGTRSVHGTRLAF